MQVPSVPRDDAGMDTTSSDNPTLTDPVAVVRHLDADAIRDRLDAIARERKALLALLRAALAKKYPRSVRKAVAGA